MSSEQRSLLTRGMGAFAAALVVMLLVGTFADFQIAQAVHAPDNPLAIFVSTPGLMAAHGLEKDAFKSFPSGHSAQAAALLASFYGLSLVYPGLRDKLGIALAIQIVFALVVMSCRMILGAHFLSDVSAGAFVSVVAFLALMALQKSRQQENDPSRK